MDSIKRYLKLSHMLPCSSKSNKVHQCSNVSCYVKHVKAYLNLNLYITTKPQKIHN